MYSIKKSEIFLPYKIAKEIYSEISDEKTILPDSSYKRGIRELLKKAFIAEHPHGIGWFFTNPNIFFNGDRMRFVKEYCASEAFQEIENKIQKLDDVRCDYLKVAGKTRAE